MTLTYRDYEAGDETSILDLYHRVFGFSYNAVKWSWRYLRNPAERRPEVCLAFDGDDLIGHSSGVPIGVTHRSRRFMASHVQDGFVDPAYQGRGVYTTLLENHSAMQRDREIDLAMGHPNANSFPVMTRRGGYTHLFDLYPFSLDVDAPLPEGRTSTDIVVADEPVFSTSDSDYLARELSRYGIYGSRSVEWLDWRYHQDSGKAYRVVRAYERGEFSGLAVFKAYESGDSIDLLEFVFRDDERLIAAALQAIADCFEGTIPRMELWSMEHYGLHMRLLSLGFHRIDRPTYFIAKAETSSPFPWREPAAYYLSMGDSDVY